MNKIFSIIFIVLLTASIFLFSYTVTLSNHPFNDYQINVINYVKGIGDLDNNFTQNEKNHLVDVKNVLFGMDLFLIMSALITTILGIHFYNKNALRKPLLISGIIGIAITITIILMSTLNFNSLFNSFHLIFFAPNSWIFPAESRIIQLFPLDFFMNMTKNILIKAGLLSLIAVILGIIAKKQ